jgi:triose/dihydroxyacetone kinase / FAD-AMP lyase (cyclizing)
MTHFVNDIGQVISESIDGYLRVSGGGLLARLTSSTGAKIVVKQGIDANKVSLISGGGSGHEPAHVGFVGQGMLTAAVCGEIFASPSVEAVLTAIRHVTGPAGCLLIVKNYAGDRLNFGLAAEKARAEGLKVEMVIVGDDIAIENAQQPRGVAGTLFVHKVAGYAAERGLGLAAVKAAAEKAANSVQSIGIASAVCTIPGRATHERLPEGMAELGLGIHGEPGIERIKLPSAGEAARLMTARFGAGPNTASGFAMIVNNLGGVPAIEMSLIVNAILDTDIGRKTQYVIGPAPLMTALDMRGFSISILSLDGDLTDALLAPTTAPAWPGVKAVAPIWRVEANDRPQAAGYAPSQKPETRRAIEAVSKAIIAAEAELNLLDAKVGDGDTGTTMAGAARNVLGAIDSLPLANSAQLCAALADTFAKSMGGSSGVLLSILSAATGHALAAGGSWPAALAAGLDRMEYYGGAREGDRTMLDALRPAVRALADGKGLTAAAAAAGDGAAKTAGMTSARAGRSSYLAARDLQGVPDPGAVAVAKAFGALLATQS